MDTQAKTHLEAAVLDALEELRQPEESFRVISIASLARSIHPRDRPEAELLRRRIATMVRTGWTSRPRDLVNVLGALGYDVELRVTPKAGPS